MNNDNNTILGFDVNLICDFFLNTERQGPGSPEVTLKALSLSLIHISPLRTKRQHYPRFDNPFLLYRVTYPFLILAGRGIFVQRVTTWRMEYGTN